MHPRRGRRTSHRDSPSQTWDTLPLYPALLSSPFSHCMELWGEADLSTWVPIQLLSFSPTKGFVLVHPLSASFDQWYVQQVIS